MKTGIYVTLVTAPGEEAAADLARTLVSESLAACVNIIPAVRSFYRWEGEIQDDSEVLMIIKTSGAVYSTMQKRILELHPYSNPEVVAFEVEEGSDNYLSWVNSETKQHD